MVDLSDLLNLVWPKRRSKCFAQLSCLELLGDLVAKGVEDLYFVEAHLEVGNQFLFYFYFGVLVFIWCFLMVEWKKECGKLRVAVRELYLLLDHSVMEVEMLYSEWSWYFCWSWDEENMEVLKWKVVKCLCQGFFCVLPPFCVLSGWMKAHFYKSFVDIFLRPLIFCWRCCNISFDSHHILPVFRCS